MTKHLVVASGSLAVMLTGPSLGLNADPMAGREAEPRLKERLMEETVNGDVLRVAGEHIVIRDTDGKEVRLHADQTSKMDKVMPGDHVKAWIAEKGHVTTLKRVEK